MANIFGIGSLNKASDNSGHLIAIKNSDAYKWNSSTGAWDAQNLNLRYGEKTRFQPYLDRLYMTQRGDAVRYFDPSIAPNWFNISNLNETPRGSDITEFNVRLYLADIILPINGYQFRSRIWFSDLPQANGNLTWGYEAGTCTVTASSAVITDSNAKFKTRNIKVGDPFSLSGANSREYTVASVDSETQITLTENITTSGTDQPYWVGGNYLEYKTNNSDFIRALGKNSEKLLIFKRDSLGKSDGLNSINDVKGSPGTTSNESVTNLNEYTYYYHPLGGILRYDGVSSKTISNPIWDYMDGVSSSMYQHVAGWTEKNRYVKFALGDVTNNDREINRPDCVAVLDTLDNQWTFESKGFRPTCTTNFIESDSINTYAGGDDGNVYQMDTGNNWDGEEMPCDISTGPIFAVSPEVNVDLTRAICFADPSLGLRIRHKLYYSHKDGRIENSFSPFSPNQESFGGNHRIEISFPDGTRGSGVEFLVEESSKTPSFLFERIALGWKNAAII